MSSICLAYIVQKKSFAFTLNKLILISLVIVLNCLSKDKELKLLN